MAASHSGETRLLWFRKESGLKGPGKHSGWSGSGEKLQGVMWAEKTLEEGTFELDLTGCIGVLQRAKERKYHQWEDQHGQKPGRERLCGPEADRERVHQPLALIF